MKKTFKQIIAALLAAVMIFGSAPLSGFLGTEDLFRVEAEAAGYEYQYPVRQQASNTQWYRPHRILNGKLKPHEGVDLSFSSGTDVFSIGDGVVAMVYSGCVNSNSATTGIDCKEAGCDPTHGMTSKKFCNNAYGNGVVIDHQNGKFSHYAHLSEVNVTLNQPVTANTVLGKVGSSGNSEAPHLHFGFANGKKWNSEYFDPFDIDTGCFLPWISIKLSKNDSVTAPTITGEFISKNNSFLSCGIEFGDSKNNLNQKSYDTNGQSNKHFYNLSKNFGTLVEGKTYYFRLWLEKSRDGHKQKYYSPVYSFKAGEGDITFVDYTKITDVNDNTGSETKELTYTLKQKVYEQYVAIDGGFYLRDIPYDVGNKIGGKVSKGDLFEVVGIYENDLYHNKWYKVIYNGVEGFVFHKHLQRVKNLSNLKYIPNYPKGKLNLRIHKQGESFEIKGEIKSNSLNIVSAEAQILKIDSVIPLKTTVKCDSGSLNSDSTSFNLKKFDSAMKFKSLDIGAYVFMVYAQLEGGKRTLINCEFFTVVPANISLENIKKTEVEQVSMKKLTNADIDGMLAIADIDYNPPIVISPKEEPVVQKQEEIKYYNYLTGVYRTTTADNLNVRTGPGSTYSKATSAIPRGTEIGITEISSNGWGKTVYNGVTGWVALNYCTYLRAFAAIQKPGTVSLNLTSEKDVPLGGTMSVSWSAITYADSYNAYLKKSDGTVVKTLTGIKGTSAYFTLDEAGTYYITVAAVNSQYVGDECTASTSVVAHSPCTVTFVDWDGRTETRTVKYGESAKAPRTPAREGHTFTGWDKAFDHVTSDITVNAKYERKSYTVKFVKPHVEGGIVDSSKEFVLGTVPVLYGDAATPPSDTQTPDGYTFAGWSNTDYLCVKENLTVEAVYQWTNADLPVIVSNVSATRISGGYEVGYNLSSTNESVTRGRVIVALITKEGKPVVTTESAAFSLASGTTNKPMQPVFIPSEDPATTAVVYVVESFGTAIPLSEAKSATVVMNDSWSAWSFDQWSDNTYDDYETRTVYRYQTKSTTTSTSKTLSGWVRYNTTTSSSSGSSYSAVSAINTDAHVRTVTTATEPVYTTYYRYHHYTNGGYNVNTKKNDTWDCSPWYGKDSGYGPTNIGPHTIEFSYKLSGQWSDTWADTLKYKYNCKEYVGSTECINTWFYDETPIQKQTGTKTRYDYTDTYYTYYFYKWSNWSSWTTTAHTTSSTKNVETATQYRYKNESLGVEDTSGVARVASTASAGLGENDILLPNLADYAGKAVTLYIYKYNEASDWTGEYIGQQTIDADGNYSFNFKLREEPSAETGNFVVSIGVEGCNNTIKIGEIIAPKPEYKAVFKAPADPSDNESEYIVIDEQTITEGSAVDEPEHPVYEGYRFMGWDTDLSYITEDTHFVQYGEDSEEKIITFIADYDPEEYVVTFIDWELETFSMKRYKYGDQIVAPMLSSEEGYEAVWDGFDEQNILATKDMVITARRTKKVYEVNFRDYNGEIINTQYVEYGSTPEMVNLEGDDSYIFIEWEYSDDPFANSETDENGNIIAGEPVVNFYPVFVFDQTVENPASSLENGTYSEAQTVELTTETEGAVIYYTLNGADPKTAVNDVDQVQQVFEYTEPIVLDRSVTLKYYACAFEHNDSETMTNYYAINAGATESKWMTEDEIPDYVTEAQEEYEITSAEGYRYKDIITTASYSAIVDYESQGWENLGYEYGEWSDWFMSEPELNDMAYELETMEPAPEAEVRYQYSRYKYDVDGIANYSPEEVAGYECELETIQLENKLSTAGYLSGTTTKYYLHENEKWFNYELVEVEVIPDYLMYRYRLMNYSLSKWSEWTTDVPTENETRETESATVYKYIIPEMYLVKIVPDYSEFGIETVYNIIEKNEYLTVNDEEYSFEGYDFLGFFTDSEFTTYFNHKTTPVTSELTLYPKYKAHEFVVTLCDYDGTVLAEETVEYGNCADTSIAEDIERDGYVFIGWDYDGLDFITEDVVATAQYVPEDEYCAVSLNYGKYNMMAGNSFTLAATVTPENTENSNIIWYSTDENVATVNDEGVVTAIAEGAATIIVETESTGFVDICEITVSTNPSESLCLTYASGLTLDRENALLRGVTNSVWTVELLKEEFMNSGEDLVMTDISGNVLADDALVGTGTVISFYNGDTLKDEISIVIIGDMNGDGYVNNRDAAMITRYLVDKEEANLCQMCAIDVNGDGYVNNRDASMVSRYLVGKETI